MPLLRQGVEHFGWRNTMVLHAGLVLQIVVLAALYRPVVTHQTDGVKRRSNDVELAEAATKQQNAHNNENISGVSEKTCLKSVSNFVQQTWDIKLFKDKIFLLVFVSVLLSFAAIEMSYKLTPYKSTAADGISKTKASFLPSIIGGASTITRVFVSFVADLKFINRTVLLASAMLIHSLGCVAFAFAATFEGYAVCAAMCGIGIGEFMSTSWLRRLTSKCRRYVQLINACVDLDRLPVHNDDNDSGRSVWREKGSASQFIPIGWRSACALLSTANCRY